MAGVEVVEAVASNTTRLRPRDVPRLRSVLRGAAGAPVDARVSPLFVEAVFFTRRPSPGAFLTLARLAGPVVDVLEEEPRGGWRDYLSLLQATLYWRAHGVAEAAWRATGSNGARGLAVLAGALAKAQEGVAGAAHRLLHRARVFLGAGVDWACASRAVDAAVEGVYFDASRCVDGGVVAALIPSS